MEWGLGLPEALPYQSPAMKLGITAPDESATTAERLDITTLFNPPWQLPTGYVGSRSACITASFSLPRIEASLGALTIGYGDTATRVVTAGLWTALSRHRPARRGGAAPYRCR